MNVDTIQDLRCLFVASLKNFSENISDDECVFLSIASNKLKSSFTSKKSNLGSKYDMCVFCFCVSWMNGLFSSTCLYVISLLDYVFDIIGIRCSNILTSNFVPVISPISIS